MLAIDPGLTLAAVALYPLMLLGVRKFGGRMMREQRRQQEALAQLTNLLQEDLSGISAIKIYGQETVEEEAFAASNRTYRDAALGPARSRSVLFPLIEGIASISLLVLLGLGSTQLENGRLSIGDLVALILYVERLVFPTALLGFTLNTFQTGQVSLERVEGFLLARREAGYTGLRTSEAMVPLLGFLRASGVVPPLVPVAAGSASEVLLASFSRYLLSERGLAASTAAARSRGSSAGPRPGAGSVRRSAALRGPTTPDMARPHASMARCASATEPAAPRSAPRRWPRTCTGSARCRRKRPATTGSQR
jgi:ABC-type multidrug transport system fused ATPase/permease subunit